MYATPAENDFRFKVFEAKANEIDQDNILYEQYAKENGLGELTEPMFGLQFHSDMTNEEFKKKFTGLSLNNVKEIVLDAPVELPETIAAQNLGQTAYDHKIRNQGECGSCWAFSTVATLEKMYYDIYRAQVDLSQQDLVDCSTEDNGCDGGWPANTYYHVADNGIAKESDYPYTGSQGRCKTNLKSPRITFGGQVTSKTITYTQVQAQNFAKMGIVAGLAIFAGGKFASIKNGLVAYDPAFAGECSKGVDHAVNLGGADALYTNIHNSWGNTWANKGRALVKPCTTGLLGSPSYITHTYSKLPAA